MALLAIIHIRDGSDDIRDSSLPPGHALVGLFDFPSRHEFKCTGNCIRGKSGAWTRDPMGFVKCDVCGSRHKGIRRRIAAYLFDWFGANLIGNDAPALFRTPDGYGPSAHADND